MERVAGRRVEQILQKLELLGKCSNKNNYQYSKKDVDKMFKAIQERVEETEKVFTDSLNKTKPTFSFEKKEE